MTSSITNKSSERGRGARELGTRNPELGTIPGPNSSAFRVPRSAFTLLEVLLSLAVIALLIGAIGIGVAGGTNTEYLRDGSYHFETVLRMARAEAASRGKSLRIVFDEQGRAGVEIEPDPLTEPGAFVPYMAGWARNVPNDRVRVARCVVNAADAYRPPDTAQVMSNETTGEERVLQPIYFRPDGSFDSAVLDLVSTDPRDRLTVVLTADSVNTIFTRRTLTPSEREARNGG